MLLFSEMGRWWEDKSETSLETLTVVYVYVCGTVKGRVEGQTMAGPLAPQKHYTWANLELSLLPSSVGVLEELSEQH